MPQPWQQQPVYGRRLYRSVGEGKAYTRKYLLIEWIQFVAKQLLAPVSKTRIHFSNLLSLPYS